MSETSDTYTCEHCGRTFPKVITDEEAAAEAREIFSPAELEATAVVCDDCWQKIIRELPRLRAELAAQAAAAGMSFDEYVKQEALR